MKGMVIPNDLMLGSVSEMLAEGHHVVIRTKGNSMLPFIVGDRDSVELVREESYGPYDIVLAEISPGKYVLHRVFIIEGNAVTLKGDGNLAGVENCTDADIKGRAVRILRPDGKDVDCTSERFLRNSRRWRLTPYIVRRAVLAIYRRII